MIGSVLPKGVSVQRSLPRSSTSIRSRVLRKVSVPSYYYWHITEDSVLNSKEGEQLGSVLGIAWEAMHGW